MDPASALPLAAKRPDRSERYDSIRTHTDCFEGAHGYVTLLAG